MRGLKEDANPAWRGDNAGYVAKHNWVRRYFGTATMCEADTTHNATRYHWSNISKQYKRERMDWQQLCPKCHWKFDHPKGMVQPAKTRSKISAGLKRAWAEGRRT